MDRNQAPASAGLDRFCIGVTVLFVLWFCRDLVLTESVPFFRDLGTYFYPLRFSLFESYASGNLPLWNRHLAMGFPVLADFQSGACYPPHLLFAALPFFTAIRVIFIFHFLVAAVGSYKLFRHWNYPCYLSIVGALLFTLGGTVVSLSNLVNHFQAAVWLPWVILFWEKAVRAVSWKSFLTFTLILSLQFLAGSPELFTLSMALVLVDGFRLKASATEVSCRRIISILFCANLVVIALTMVQLLPTVELFLQSRRHQPIPAREALQWSLNPWSLLNLFFLDKEVDLGASIGMHLFFAREASWFVSYYVGAISVFGICLWMCSSSVREKITLSSLGAASLLMALGSYTPIYPFFLRHMPILSAIRFPEKFFFFTYALIIYTAVKGLADFLDCDKAVFKKAAVVLSAVCLAWVGAYLYLRSNLSLVAHLIAESSGVQPSSAVQTAAVAAVLANLERQIAISMALVSLLALAKTEKIRRSIFAVLLVSIVFVDLASAHRGFLFSLNPEFIYKSPRILQEPDPERDRLFYYPSGRNLHPSFYLVRGQPPFKEASALFFQNLLPNAGIFHGFDYFQEIDALARQPYTEFLSFANPLKPVQQIQMLRTFNVRYLVSFQPLSIKGVTLVARFPEFFSWLYKIGNPLPRTYIVDKFSVEQNSDRIFRKLLDPEFDPTQEIVLDQSIPITPKARLKATAKIVRYENQRVVIQASLNDPGILVLADSYYPGWKAYVDGREQTIRRANLFFRAVSLSAGKHTVEFRYEPRSFAIGRVISGATVVILIVVSVIFYLRERKGTVVTRGF